MRREDERHPIWHRYRDGPRLCRSTRPLVAGLLLGVLLAAVALLAALAT